MTRQRSHRFSSLSLMLMLAVFMSFLVVGERAASVTAQAGLPDLSVDGDALKSSVDLQWRFFRFKNCAVFEECALPGFRKVMRFTVVTPNLGDADLVLGDPEQNTELFEFSPCHGHYHLKGYAEYALLRDDEERMTVLIGRKQAFCMTDSFPYTDHAGPRPKYHCEFQGLSVGWADIYGRDLDCQWLDVTGLSAGKYLLRVTVNPEFRLVESDYENNAATIPVTIQ